MKIKITNGTLITLGEKCQVLENHDLIIHNNKIEKIVPKSSNSESFDKVIDATGKVVLPSYINAHTHCYSAMARGLSKVKSSKDFLEVLENLWWKLDEKLTLQDSYYSALTTFLDGIKQGTTTFFDHHSSPNAISGSLFEIAKAVEKTGVRASLCYELSNRSGDLATQKAINENLDFIKYCSQNQSDNLAAMFGMHASFTINDESMIKATELAKKYNSGFHIHAAESVLDQEVTKRIYGKSVISRLNDFNILGEKTIAAHSVHIDENEIEILASSNTNVVHNPQSNLNNSVGIADIIKMKKHGVFLGLGTDAMTNSMPQEARVALWAQHYKQDNPSSAFMEIVDMLYKNNAKIVKRIFNGLHTGVLEKNSAADIILVNYDPITPLDDSSVFGHLIYGISEAKVDTTICNGKILMENQEIKLDLDEKKINVKSRELTKELWKRF